MNKYLRYIIIMLGISCQLSAVAQKQSVEVDGESSNPKLGVAYRQVDSLLLATQISVVDVKSSLESDMRTSVSSALNGKVTGFLGGTNVRGYGTAVYVVDGIVVRDVDYLDLQEVDNIVVLKDAASRVLYGVDAQTSVIQITTRRGDNTGHHIGASFEYGVRQAIAYPDYLDAATYKTMYNQALDGDGYSAKYSQTEINDTASGLYPYAYPDFDYYSDMFVNSIVPSSKIKVESYGGNDSAKYYVNMGWQNEDSWIAMGDYSRNLFNIRGNVDYQVNDWLKMTANVWAIFDSEKIPVDDLDYYSVANTYLPTLGPLLIPTSYISNIDELGELSTVFGDYVLGGSTLCYDGDNSTYRNVIGDLVSKGTQTDLSRHLTFNTGVELDLDRITKGLSAKATLSYDFFNQYGSYPENSYAVYSISSYNDDNTVSVSQIGTDSKTTANTVEGGYFYRDFSLNSTVNYDRTFGDHYINAVGIFSILTQAQNYTWQNNKRVTFGGQATYAFKNKYILDAGFATVGSSKLDPSSRFGTSPTVAGTWVLSEESFMKDVSWIDSFRVNAGWGRILNDKWTSGDYSGYFLYDTLYASDTTNGDFTYGNGLYSSGAMAISSIGSAITWQQRDETTIGVSGVFLDRKLQFEASVFESHEKNIITEMANATPGTMGDFSIYENYNAIRRRGYEIGLSYSNRVGDLRYSISGMMLYTADIRTQYDEAENLSSDLSGLNLSSSTLWGLVADGVYMPSDFNSDGDLKGGYPVPTWGSVQEGDIRYIDQNGDMVINEDDVVNLGINYNNVQYSLNVNLNYKQFGLFVQGVGQAGGRGMLSSDYYWVNGANAKYSSVVLGAYNSDSPEKYPDYPRLSTSDNSHNYRYSSFWLYDRDYFNLSAVQLSYNFKLPSTDGVKNLQLYLRGENLLTIAKDKDIIQLNVGSSPQYRTYAIGAVYNF